MTRKRRAAAPAHAPPRAPPALLRPPAPVRRAGAGDAVAGGQRHRGAQPGHRARADPRGRGHRDLRDRRGRAQPQLRVRRRAGARPGRDVRGRRLRHGHARDRLDLSAQAERAVDHGAGERGGRRRHRLPVRRPRPAPGGLGPRLHLVLPGPDHPRHGVRVPQPDGYVHRALAHPRPRAARTQARRRRDLPGDRRVGDRRVRGLPQPGRLPARRGAPGAAPEPRARVLAGDLGLPHQAVRVRDRRGAGGHRGRLLLLPQQLRQPRPVRHVHVDRLHRGVRAGRLAHDLRRDRRRARHRGAGPAPHLG